MDVLKYIPVLLMLCGGGDTGGQGSHHDHVKVHVPEFIHHDHHTKIITIHHHHHKPKEKHHHHHHHHHHKPVVPYGHHYHKHKKSHTKTLTTTTQGQGLKNLNHGHGHKSYHHPSHHSKPKHHDTPSYDAPPTFEYKPFAPSVPAIPQAPQVYGVQHTVKQVKVFDSLPGAIPTSSHGYEVTEEDENSDDDAFTAINSLTQTYPATFGYVRNADPAQNEVLADFPVQSSFQANDAFAAPQPTYANSESFGYSDPFSSQDAPTIPSSQFPMHEGSTGFDDPANAYAGDTTGTALVSDDGLSDDTPVSFSREAGIQETIKTGGVETVVY